MDLPGPLCGVGAEVRGLLHEALRDRPDALYLHRIAVEYTLLLRLRHHLGVGLLRALLDFLGGDDEALAAVDAYGAGLGGLDALAPCHQGKSQRRKEFPGHET